MGRSHPIWNDVTACKYNSDKSFGFTDTGEIKIKVGSSAKNSHDFLTTLITRRKSTFKNVPVWIFKYSVDDVVLKISVFTDNKGRAGDHWFDKSKLTAIKSLKLEK